MSEARSRVGPLQIRADGSTVCRLLIPLGHPASRRRDQDDQVFEVESWITYAAGPGSQELRQLEPGTGRERAVGEDLLPTAGEPVRISADNLAAYLRKAARVFDTQVAAAC